MRLTPARSKALKEGISPLVAAMSDDALTDFAIVQNRLAELSEPGSPVEAGHHRAIVWMIEDEQARRLHVQESTPSR